MKSSKLFIEYCNSTELPDGVWGYLDWLTGFLRVNTDESMWYQEKWPDSFLDTITHELAHAFQISVCGYMHNFSIKALKLLKQTLPPLPIDNFDDLLANIQLLDNGSLLRHFNQLDYKSKEEISIKFLIESMAYFIHKKNIYPNLTHNEYKKHHLGHMGNEYKKTYLFLESFIGEYTFIVFDKVIFTALCFEQPVIVFLKICQELSFMENKNSNIDIYLDLINSYTDALRNAGYAYYSSPIIYTNSLNINPFFMDSVKYLSKKVHDEKKNILKDMDEIFENYIQEAFRPVFFNTEKSYIPTLLPDNFSNLNQIIQIEKKEEATVILIIFIINLKLLSKNNNLNYFVANKSNKLVTTYKNKNMSKVDFNV